MQQLQELKILDRCFSESLTIQHLDLKTKLQGKAKRAFNKLTHTNDGEDIDTDDDEEEDLQAKPKLTELRTRFLTLCYLIPKVPKKTTPSIHASPPNIAQNAPPDTTAENVLQKEASMKLLIRLIATLYEEKTFFQDVGMKEQDIEALMKLFFDKAKILAGNTPIKNKLDLANVIVENSMYEEVIYKILKGNNPIKKKWGDTKLESPENYDSLLEYVNLQKRETLMSVYLAPRPLLLALFQDPAVVEEIIKEREVIYGKLNSKKGDAKLNSVSTQDTTTPAAPAPAELYSEEFQRMFAQKLPHDMDPTLIDFAVSKTKPSN